MANSVRQVHQFRRPLQLSGDPATTGMVGGESYFHTGNKEFQVFDGSAFQPMAPDVPIFVVYEGPLAVHTGTKRFYVAGAGTHRLVGIRGHLEVPGSGNVRVDINKNGTTIHTTQSNRLSLTTANGGVDSVPIGNIEVNKFTVGDHFTFDIDNDGVTPAQGLTVALWYRRSGP